ncbi:MAG: alpha/beta hydrolase [Myxococcales bacterium]|nr:alpha/beta hydrolase [Myxococcales bacterium]
MEEILGSFRSLDGQRKFLEAYEKTLSHWPEGWVSQTIDTEEGQTHFLCMGPEDAPPLVLLHGFRVSATMWGANIQGLAKHFRVYCLDTMGDWGKSRTSHKKMLIDDLVVWLEHVREALGLESFFLGGMSYGGWLSLKYAARFPERVRRMCVIAPGASFAPMSLPFILRGIPSLLFPSFGVVNAFMTWASVAHLHQEDAFYKAFFHDFVAQMALGFRYGRSPKMSLPATLSDEVLRSIQAPCLLLLGEQEKIYPPKKAIARAVRCMSSLKAVLLPDASHDISIAQRERVNQEIIAFLEDA